MAAPEACDRCIAHAWLLGRLAGHLERVRARIGSVLELDDEQLIDAVGGDQAASVRTELRRLDADRLRERSAAGGLELICRCDGAYPAQLRALVNPPAVLDVAGGLERFLAL